MIKKKHSLLLALLTALVIGGVFVLAFRRSVNSETPPESVETARPLGPHNNVAAAFPSAPTAIDESKPNKMRRPFIRSKAGEGRVISSTQDMSSLKSDADEGNPNAAYQLATELYECSLLDNQYQRLEAKINSSAIEPAAADRQMQRLESKFGKCSGLSSADFDRRFEYVEKAALAGDIDAQVNYSAIYGEQLSNPRYALDPDWLRSYRDKSLGFLKSAESRGSVDAMSTLAHAYWDGLIVQQSRVLAYANMHAAMRSGLLSSAQSVLNVWQVSMTSEEVSQAQELGNRIYSQCCGE